MYLPGFIFKFLQEKKKLTRILEDIFTGGMILLYKASGSKWHKKKKKKHPNGSRPRHSFPQSLEIDLLLQTHNCVLLWNFPQLKEPALTRVMLPPQLIYMEVPKA